MKHVWVGKEESQHTGSGMSALLLTNEAYDPSSEMSCR